MQESQLCRCEAVKTRRRYRRIRDSRKVVNAAMKRREHGSATDAFGPFRHPETDSDTRAEPERSLNGAQNSERSTGLREDAPMQKRSPSGARAEPERRKDAERSTGHRKDVRAREITLLRDPRISRHRWGLRWAFKPIWRPVRSRGTRPAVISRAADPLASCESQTHVYNDIIPRQMAAGGLEMTPRRLVRYLQRNLSVHLYRVPWQTGAGILDAQSGSKAYLDVQNHKSKTRTYPGPVGSGRRTAGRRGGARLGRTRRRWVDPARKQPFLLPSSESRTLSRTYFRKHEQSNSYLKPTEEQNPWLIRG